MLCFLYGLCMLMLLFIMTCLLSVHLVKVCYCVLPGWTVQGEPHWCFGTNKLKSFPVQSSASSLCLASCLFVYVLLLHGFLSVSFRALRQWCLCRCMLGRINCGYFSEWASPVNCPYRLNRQTGQMCDKILRVNL